MYDSDTGLVRFGARDYDAESGRWTAKDPSGLSGGLNVYEYAAGDPIDLVDIDGNVAVLIVGAEVASGAIWGAMTDLLLQIALNGPRCIDWGQVWSAAKSGAVFGIFAGLFRAWNAPWFCLTGCFVKGTLVDTERGRRPIEEVALGDRVGPESSECASVSTEDWVDIGLDMGPRDEGSPGRVVLHLLRPREWVEANGAREGSTIELELRELNIEGSARVTSVRAAPGLSAGSRCPVTGTIRRTGVRVIAVELERGAPMELTANHRVFSATRNGWVAAGDLRAGEELQAREGTVRVRSVRESARGLTSVFNLEVFARHEFFVGEAGVRAHNGYTGDQRRLLGLSREERIAEYFGGRVSNEVVITPFGWTDLDVIAGSGDLIAVGGAAKTASKVAHNLQKLQFIAEQRGVRVRAVFARSTPDDVLRVARNRLGHENVFVVSF
ncbi:MAG: hypothetical protein JNK05_14255 [Myxococcales bacterium]|nr:hypothetical protein [Myxococcales bacterium]